MKITCIADLHGYKPSLPGGDLLIVAGDCTAQDKMAQWVEFYHWLKEQKYHKKILVAGNHDGTLRSMYPTTKEEADELAEVSDWMYDIGEMDKPDFEYLCDWETEFEGFRIYGSPWTPTFNGINPACTTFCAATDVIKPYFDAIPDGIDILVTHGPPYGTLDVVYDFDGAKQRCGSKALAQAVKRVKPRLHVFGHIHEGYGTHTKDGTTYVNCSHVNQFYRPVNSYQEIVLP